MLHYEAAFAEKAGDGFDACHVQVLSAFLQSLSGDVFRDKGGHGFFPCQEAPRLHAPEMGTTDVQETTGIDQKLGVEHFRPPFRRQGKGKFRK